MSDNEYMLIIDTEDGPDGGPTYWRISCPNRSSAEREVHQMQWALQALASGPIPYLPHYDDTEDLWHCMPGEIVMGFSSTTRIRLYQLHDDWQRTDGVS